MDIKQAKEIINREKIHNIMDLFTEAYVTLIEAKELVLEGDSIIDPKAMECFRFQGFVFPRLRKALKAKNLI